MGMKERLIKRVEETTEELLKALNELRDKSNDKGKEGVTYFARRAQYLMDKIENLDSFRYLVDNMDFQYVEGTKSKSYNSIYGTYCYKTDFYYNDLLLEEDEETIDGVVLNEIIYSMTETAARGTNAHIKKVKGLADLLYYHLGLILTLEDITVNSLHGALEKLKKEHIYIEPNQKSIIRRYKKDNEDGVINYFTIIRSDVNMRMHYTYAFRRNGDRRKMYRNLISKNRFM